MVRVKIGGELFERAAIAAVEAGGSGGISMITDRALLAFLAALDIEITDGLEPHIWVLRTWADVRRGDVVRMPGQEATAAEVMELVTLGWHVNDRPPAQNQGEPDHAYAERVKAFNGDVQYRPNEHAGEWTARPVTLRPLAADDPATRHRIPNVNPGAPVEIRCTQVELDAIELLGGWSQRVAVTGTPS
jgi:hypothetical protein